MTETRVLLYLVLLAAVIAALLITGAFYTLRSIEKTSAPASPTEGANLAYGGAKPTSNSSAPK